ncbi:MAG TPA: ATP synthase F0 subunit B [Granulicella sp.]|jgi:F-type H+-transporting ATPase subunit b|nr:ATP synthase F0 subunit B [Granulicella sp.]
MTEILDQLGGLVLGSVPTILLFLLLIVAYGLLVRRPLDRTLAERRARTLGAVDKAKEAISAAEAQTAAYEEKLRAARAEIYQAREQRLKAWAAERDQAIQQAKAATQERVLAARQEIERSVMAAQKDIEGASAALSAQILRAVLPAGVRSREEVAQ